jgi:GTPase SAR1 family protein
MCFDITNRRSFEQISHWRDELMNYIDETFVIPILLVGTKIDLENLRTVYVEEAEALAEKLGFEGYIEVSAKRNQHIDTLVSKITCLMNEHDNNRVTELDNVIFIPTAMQPAPTC